jgi:hypothetical protein
MRFVKCAMAKLHNYIRQGLQNSCLKYVKNSVNPLNLAHQFYILGGIIMNNAQKIILFCGLFDQTSKAQEISTLDAYKIASNLVTETIGFGTITEALGVYTHDDGTIVNEPTLRIEVSGIDIESMKRLAIALKQAFNQESIGFEVVKTDFSFV